MRSSPTVTVTLENTTPDAITFDTVCIFFPENFSWSNITPVSPPDAELSMDNGDSISIISDGAIPAGATYEFTFELEALCGAELTESPEVAMLFKSNEFDSDTLFLSGFQVLFADLSIIST